jgi:CheY-like chemotaxis protein
LPKSVVLVAEDDRDTLDTVRELLEAGGFEVIGAEDSLLAYSLLASRHPDVIVTDIMMPRVNGIGLVRWIRNDPLFATIPIIAMTAYGDNYLAEAKQAGATRIIHKPDEIPDLPHIVSLTLNQGG